MQDVVLLAREVENLINLVRVGSYSIGVVANLHRDYTSIGPDLPYKGEV